MSETETAVKPIPLTNDGGDHDRFAHYVYRLKGDPRDAKTLVTEAIVTGTPVRALCGKVWVPSRDPKNFPVCPECKDILETLRSKG